LMEKQLWTFKKDDIVRELELDPDGGLDPGEAAKRLRKYGPNRLRQVEKVSVFRILLNQFKSLVIVLLLVAAGVSFMFSEWLDCGAIAAVIVINTVLGFFTEIRAVRSMEALRSLGSVTTKVKRGGAVQEIPAHELVLGDLVILEGGDVVTADMRLLVAFKLEADESTLTGESMPVGKQSDPLAKDTPLAERSNMLFKGTSVTRGSGEAVVVSTGMNTELGRISSLVEEAGEEKTPLEQNLDRMARRLIGVSLAIAALVIAAGLLRGKDLLLMIETGIALAIASIPEGLPIVSTIALARGMWRMARKNALVNRLSSVETLGSTNVIFTDKTGTLTENRMTLVRMESPSGILELESRDGEEAFFLEGELVTAETSPRVREMFECMVLCNNASLEEGEVGDPLEVALLEAGQKAGVSKKPLFEKMPEQREEAFDSNIKMMATFNTDGLRLRVSVKGAPEAVLSSCSRIWDGNTLRSLTPGDREEWSRTNDRMAREGLRVIALASQMVNDTDDNPYENLIFLGMVGLLDPPRDDVRGAVTLCRQAGIRIVVVTGDQLITARNVAHAVNLIDDMNEPVFHGNDLKPPEELTPEEREQMLEARLFARVSPKQKLDLISLHQETGDIVAMTGDGVNDAPALKKADIGVAMGQRGTQVAREAADMILKDDSFSTIALAVEQGRIIYNNIRKFIFYLLSCNVSEVMIIFSASLLFKKLPILPLQILFLNFVTDVFPALALGVGEGSPLVMKMPARDPSEPLLKPSHWKGIFGYGALITLSVLGAFLIASRSLDLDDRGSVTVAFMTLALAQIWHVFNMREKGSGLLKNEITRNVFVWGAIVLCVGLLLVAVYVPLLAEVLKITPPDLNAWLLILAMSLVPFLAGQLTRGRRILRGDA